MVRTVTLVWLGWLSMTAAAAAQGPPAIEGTWETLDRHVAMGSLYQPVHGVRKREGLVHFAQKDGRLVGWAVHEDHAAITHQERWKDGRTEFKNVAYADGKLTFQWDIGEWIPTAGPIAVEDHKLENKGTVRVEAAFQGQRLVGTWKMFLADGTEVFRGEWEAKRLIPGPVLLIGGRHQDLTDEIKRLFGVRAGGGQARIVVIPTGVADVELADLEQFRRPWLELKPRSVKVLHTRDPKTANDPEFVKPLTEATAVFFTNGHRHRILDAYRGTLVESELKKLRARGKLIAGTGTGAAVLGELVIHRPENEELTEAGLGILAGFLTEDKNDLERFAEGIKAHPDHVALLIEPEGAVLIHDQKLRAVGTGKVTVSLPQAKQPQLLKAGEVLALSPQRPRP